MNLVTALLVSVICVGDLQTSANNDFRKMIERDKQDKQMRLFIRRELERQKRIESLPYNGYTAPKKTNLP